MVYDGLVRDVVDGGAGMLVVQTNNATFGYTDETAQQLAMSRLRAVEHGRAVVVAATSGISAIVAPDGTIVALVELFTPASSSRRSPSATPTTVAQRLGAGPEWVLAALGRRRAGRRRAVRRCGARDGPPVTGRVLVIVPTYNEVENLERILERLRASVPDAHALVVDDGSPDGTGELADKLAARDPRVHVLHRAGKAGPRRGLHGRASAGPASTATTSSSRWTPTARTPPSSCPGLLAALASADLVLGSRYVPGGAVTDWPLHRLLLSRAGNRYTRWALRLPLTDATGGYRAARGELIDRLPFDDVASQGYCFQVDWAWRAVRAGRPGRRGADHVHRTRVRQEQDERFDR